MAFSLGNLLIVGAGFSANAGLPLANQFTSKLLEITGLRLDGPSSAQTKFIREFVDRVFGEGAKRSAEQWPELEDIFTLVDLSANTGHHLGPDHSAARLRIVRRAIIVRMIRMLSREYRQAQRTPNLQWQLLEQFFERFDGASTAVLSMNWDTVFEQGISRTQNTRRFDYGCGAKPVSFNKTSLTERSIGGKALHIVKPHGSTNWLYCDACRETFWVTPSETEQVAQTLFRKRDWDEVLSKKAARPTMLSPGCPHCGADSLGTRFATFSYRKALDFPMHAASWRTAEGYLKDAIDWVFIGYSMPPADFDFKHLLKRVHLTEERRPKITVITGGDKAAAEATVARFDKFFGYIPGERTYLKRGLDAEALDHLELIKVLHAKS